MEEIYSNLGHLHIVGLLLREFLSEFSLILLLNLWDVMLDNCSREDNGKKKEIGRTILVLKLI